MSKKKDQRSGRKRTYYAAQFAKTDRNKARRAAKRRNKAAHWAKKKADAAKSVNATIGETN